MDGPRGQYGSLAAKRIAAGFSLPRTPLNHVRQSALAMLSSFLRRCSRRSHEADLHQNVARPARLICRCRMVNEDCSSVRCSPAAMQKLRQAFRLRTRVPEVFSSTRIDIELTNLGAGVAPSHAAAVAAVTTPIAAPAPIAPTSCHQ